MQKREAAQLEQVCKSLIRMERTRRISGERCQISANGSSRTFPHAIGEQIYLALFAPTVSQARIAHGYIDGLLRSHPTTAALITGETTQTSIPMGDLVVECLPANFKTLRSRSFGLVVIDEACFLPTDDSAIPDTELLRAVRPGLARVPGSLLIVISSPYARRGEMYRAYEKHFGQEGHDTLFINGGTLDFNPTFDRRELARAMEEDPEAARAEYLGEFRSDLEALFSIERIAAVTPTGVAERSPQTADLRWVRAFVDPSGGSSDSFTLGIAGSVGEAEHLLCVREWKPPFSPADVVAEIVQVVKTYSLCQVTGDAYSGEFVRELFRKEGLTYQPSLLNRSGIYLDALAMINAKRCSLLDVPKLRAQLVALERRVGRTMDIIDHPRGFHDDLANAALGALVAVKRKMPVRTGWG